MRRQDSLLKPGVDVNIVRVVNELDVTSTSHSLETVSTHELNLSGTVAALLLHLQLVFQPTGKNRLCLELSDLEGDGPCEEQKASQQK